MAVLMAAGFGLTAMAVAQSAPPQDQSADPAAQNSAAADAPPPPASNVIPDAQVEANVLNALAGAPTLADQPISTTTTYGTVTLSGTVKDEASKKLAAQLASTSPGVKKVVDALEVGDISTASAQPVPEGSAPLPNNAPPPPDQSAQAAPVEQGQPELPVVQGSQPQGQYPYPQPTEQANQPQGQYPQGQYPQPTEQASQPQYAPQPEYRNPNCPPLYTPDGRPYPPPPGCPGAASGSPYAAGGPQYQGQYPGQPGGQEVTVPPGAFIQIRVSQGMDSKHTPVGSTFNGILMNDVMAGGSIALPRGAEVTGVVVDARAAGGLTGSSVLALQLTSIVFGGQQYPLESAVWGVNGPSKTGQTVGDTVGLGLFGAIIGAAAGGGPGAAVGAVAGGTAGMAASAATSGPQAFVPPESLLNFSLARPITVTTVSQAELNRLAMAAPGPRGYPPPGYYGRRPVYYYPYAYPY